MASEAEEGNEQHMSTLGAMDDLSVSTPTDEDRSTPASPSASPLGDRVSHTPDPPALVDGAPPSPSRVLNINKPTAGDENNLFVGDLAKELTEDELVSAFSKAGTVIEASIKRDKQTGKNLGYGFVRMATQAEAQAAKNQLHEHELKGRKIRVGWAMKNTCLFALDLCPTVTSQMLRDVFRQFGNLVEDETMIRKSKGMGIIRFQTRASAENARRSMNGVMLGRYPLNIEWTYKAGGTRGRDSPGLNGLRHGLYVNGGASTGSLQSLGGYAHHHSSSTGSLDGLYEAHSQQQYHAFQRAHSQSPPQLRRKQPVPPHHHQSPQQHRHQQQPQQSVAMMYDLTGEAPAHMVPPHHPNHQHQQTHPYHHQPMYQAQFPQPQFDQYGQPIMPYMPVHPGFPAPMHQAPPAPLPMPQPQQANKFMSSVQVGIRPTSNVGIVAEAEAETEADADTSEEASVADQGSASSESYTSAESEETFGVMRASDTKSSVGPLDAKRTERVVRDLFGKFGVVTGVSVLKVKPSKASPAKELVAVVHFEPSPLGEQLALAAYTGLDGTTCNMKSDEELSTLVLTRCMSKSKSKGRSSAEGQVQQTQQTQQTQSQKQSQQSQKQSQQSQPADIFLPPPPLPLPPPQQQQPVNGHMAFHPAMALMYAGNGMPPVPLPQDGSPYGVGSPVPSGEAMARDHATDTTSGGNEAARDAPQLPQGGMPPLHLHSHSHMVPPGFHYPPPMYQMGPNGPVPVGHLHGYMSQDVNVTPSGTHPAQHQLPPQFQQHYPSHLQQQSAFMHQGAVQAVQSQQAPPLSSVLDAASAARHSGEWPKDLDEGSNSDEAALVHQLESGLELNVASDGLERGIGEGASTATAGTTEEAAEQSAGTIAQSSGRSVPVPVQ